VYLAGYGTFMEKEIFEQPESVINTMRGRVDFDNYKGNHFVV
jgi:glucosamine--fructose-6-phosphate aminotransferase (isomerizing)